MIPFVDTVHAPGFEVVDRTSFFASDRCGVRSCCEPEGKDLRIVCEQSSVKVRLAQGPDRLAASFEVLSDSDLFELSLHWPIPDDDCELAWIGDEPVPRGTPLRYARPLAPLRIGGKRFVAAAEGLGSELEPEVELSWQEGAWVMRVRAVANANGRLVQHALDGQAVVVGRAIGEAKVTASVLERRCNRVGPAFADELRHEARLVEGERVLLGLVLER